VVLAEVSLEPIKNSAGDGNGVFLAVGDENLGHKITSLCDNGGARQCVNSGYRHIIRAASKERHRKQVRQAVVGLFFDLDDLIHAVEAATGKVIAETEACRKSGK